MSPVEDENALQSVDELETSLTSEISIECNSSRMEIDDDSATLSDMQMEVDSNEYTS